MIRGAVLYAKSLDRLVDFYASLGFDTVEPREADHAVLHAAGTELVIVQAPPDVAAKIELSEPPVVRVSACVKLVFEVPSIDAVLRVAESKGGIIPKGARRWVFRGNTVQDAVDPEGNVYQLRQLQRA